MKRLLHSTTLGRCFSIFDRRARRKILLALVLQVVVSFLDLIGVALLGLIGVLAIRGVESVTQGSKTKEVIRLLHLTSFTFQQQALIIGLAASVALLMRTFASIIISRRTLYYIAEQSANLSTSLVSRVLNKSLISLNRRSLQETLYSVTSGVEKITFGVIGICASIVADFGLIIILFVALLATNFILSVCTLVLFSIVGFSLYFSLHKKAKYLGSEDSRLQIKSYQRISEVFGSYREILVRNRRSFYVEEIKEIRNQYSRVVAENTFMPNISKYVVEGVLVISSLVLCGVEVSRADAVHSFATLAVFLAAGTRIAPALLRLQQNSIVIKNNLAMATPTLKLIDELKASAPLPVEMRNNDFKHEGFVGSIIIKNLSFTYPEKIVLL